MNKTILFISYDPVEFRRRILNQIETARALNYKIKVISTSSSQVIKEKYDFDYTRISLPAFFNRGLCLYPWFNIALFIKILFRDYNIIHFRGIIPIPAVLMRQHFNKSKLIYDAHEYFRGHQIFQKRPVRKKVWMWFEKKIIRHLEAIITVSEPLAEFLQKDYPTVKTVEVIRSIPDRDNSKEAAVHRSGPNKTAVFHGYFLPGRALENIIRAMANIQDDSIKLLLIGTGPLKDKLEFLAHELKLGYKIQFVPFVENEKLIGYISKADIGLTIIEPDCTNRKYALPNKFFEYIHAGLPVLASNIPTLQKYVNKYRVGLTVDPRNAESIAEHIVLMLSDSARLRQFKMNCQKAARELNWEKESEKLIEIYRLIMT